jgi:hypothetical protein
MKSMHKVMVAALAAGSMALGFSAQAASHGGGGGGGGHGGGGWSGGGHGGWSGGHGGSWHGSAWHGGGYHGGYYHGGYGHYHSTAVGFYFGAPWVWGPWYWGWGYPYYGYGYPAYAPYGDYPAAPGPDAGGGYPEGTMEGPPTTEVDPNAPGAPTQAPAYMNYCVSAKAYFPKVTSCPEGWKFVPAQ